MNIEYPYLPEGREILYVLEDDSFMKEAKETARNFSTDRLHPTGAVIVKDGEIVIRVANQVFLKHPKFQEWHQKGLCSRKFLKIKSGTKYWLCPGCAGHESHSEARGALEAKNKGMDIFDTDLYLWGHWWCCKPCWDKMISAGIKNVYLLEGSEKLFNAKHPDNILGNQFK